MSKGKGIVYLVGAGPGDIGLMTIKGRRCLERADAVVYDFHLNAQVLNYISKDAEFLYAGKRGGHHTMTQDQINEVIVEKAKEGKTVCRLKGGDPFVFGRGGEEAERLAEEGIPFEVVPGISSSIAAPAYAGIPLTHRKYSSSFAVIPGYEDTTKESSSIDWAKLATGVGTLVFLMAVKNLPELTKKLIDNGRPADTPVAVVRWGTRADQVTLVSTLEKVAGEVKASDIRPPAVMIVGEVVRLREKLSWYEGKPLSGVRVLLTRESTSGMERLEDLGAELIAFPTIKIEPAEDPGPLDRAIKAIGDGSRVPDWLVLTSGNAVERFFGRLMALGLDIRELKGVRVCAVGRKTAAKIEALGIRVDLLPEKFNAESLAGAIAKEHGGSLDGVRFLMPRAEKGREILPEAVRSLGGEIDVPVAYRAARPRRRPKRLVQFLREGRISVATFTSGATFTNFIELVEGACDLLKEVAIAVIGPVTKKAVEEAGLKVDIMPGEATTEALAEDIIKWVETGKRGSMKTCKGQGLQ
jgi:uroporphyrinogen III methyltransferase/synthase